MKNPDVYTQISEIGSAEDQIKTMQNLLLDIFDPKDQKKINLLKELVSLQNELEDLEKQFADYIQENC